VVWWVGRVCFAYSGLSSEARPIAVAAWDLPNAAARIRRLDQTALLAHPRREAFRAAREDSRLR